MVPAGLSEDGAHLLDIRAVGASSDQRVQVVLHETVRNYFHIVSVGGTQKLIPDRINN
jgi:hypothetical protein